jgi:hypothetical protein
VPAAQLVQLALPGLPAKVPGEQSVHAAAPEAIA